MKTQATRPYLLGSTLIRLVAVTAVMVLCAQAVAQSGPPDRTCILLGILGSPLPPQCVDDDGEMMEPPMVTGNASLSLSNIYLFDDPEVMISDASSALTRNDRGVSFQLHTSELAPDSAYTVWWVVFNNPEYCQGDICGLQDLPLPDFPDADPRVEAALLWATGDVSNDLGRARFSAHLFAGADAPGEVLFGPDPLLQDSNAEIHLIVRSHGPRATLTGDELNDALTTFAGGCAEFEAGPNDCADVQFSVHLP
ncbi:MAG: hypothetical protein ACNA7J_12470 [Wenzhouxiangella sp.]